MSTGTFLSLLAIVGVFGVWIATAEPPAPIPAEKFRWTDAARWEK